MQSLRINVPPPLERGLQLRLSFAPFIRYLQQQKQAASSAKEVTYIYDYLIAKFTPYLSLLQPTAEIVLTEPIAELFTLLKFSILPLIHQGDEIPYAIGLPCQPLTLFQYSDTFKQLTSQPEELFPHTDSAIIREDSLRAFYRLILEKCYHVPVSKAASPLVTFRKTLDGLTRYYRLRLDFRFIDPTLLGKLPLPPLRAEWVAFAQNELRTAAEMPVLLPLEQFTFDGFAFFLIEDITEEATIQELKEVFVHLSSEDESHIYSRFEKALRNLCGQPDLQIGIMPFLQVNGHYVHHTAYTSRSIFLKHIDWSLDETKNPEVQALLCKIAANPKAWILNDLAHTSEPEHRILYQHGIRSFILYPLVVANRALGMLEIGSPHAGALNGEVLRKLEQATPLIIELLLYQRNQFRVRMEEIIRQKFTLLQPALEWKFTEAAWAYLRQEKATEFTEDESTQVSFKQVYPFYGAIDVRNSSTERNKALQQDLNRQFRFIIEILQLPGLSSYQIRPEQLLAKSWYWQRRLLEKISPEEEEQVTDFLKQQVNPYFKYLRQHHAELTTRLQPYLAETDTTGLYQKVFQAYEESMMQINTTINGYLERESKQLQQIYPHYFEKFRTDGLEYNLYVGSPIAPWLPFRSEHLQQFRSWQLSSMIQMAWLTHRLLPALPLPLQTTQLILAHSHPVDINFRLDEHRFDVEGSYSIRYEVIKKRLDKAYVKGTNERLTQPDTIALVYTTRPEIEDYLPGITRLQEQGKLLPDKEFLELEPLQGITGLKALRFRINY